MGHHHGLSHRLERLPCHNPVGPLHIHLGIQRYTRRLNMRGHRRMAPVGSIRNSHRNLHRRTSRYPCYCTEQGYRGDSHSCRGLLALLVRDCQGYPPLACHPFHPSSAHSRRRYRRSTHRWVASFPRHRRRAATRTKQPKCRNPSLISSTPQLDCWVQYAVLHSRRQLKHIVNFNSLKRLLTEPVRKRRNANRNPIHFVHTSASH